MKLFAILALSLLVLSAPGVAMVQAWHGHSACTMGCDCGKHSGSQPHRSAHDCAPCCLACPAGAVAVLPNATKITFGLRPICRLAQRVCAGREQNYPPPVPPPRLAA